jgi:regulation of enolase protein 1 (concanavalin A-like superfamily)
MRGHVDRFVLMPRRTLTQPRNTLPSDYLSSRTPAIMWLYSATRLLKAKTLLVFAALLICSARPAGAADQVYFSAVDDVAAKLAERIYAENVRIDMSAWYLTDSTVYQALLSRFRAGVQVRLIGDRGSIFEIDKNTRDTFYRIASEGVPIRLRYNPTWYPEIDHWKATIFAGQNIVAFGSANYTPFELTPFSSTNYKDEVTLFTSDPALVGAFKTKFDKFWHDTDPEPESLIPSAPYFKNWDDACATEPMCSDYRTQYPDGTRTPMVINTARLEPDNPLPPEMVWGQGPSFNNRLVDEITKEQTAVDFVIYRLTVENIGNALLAKNAAGVPIRLIIEPDEYTNRKWPEFWLTHANLDKLWAAGIPMKMRAHTGLTHMKVLITSTLATIASSNYSASWQRDNDYFMPATAKPAIYTAIKNRFQFMWSDNVGFTDFRPQRPDAPTPTIPASGSSGVPTTTSLTWDRAVFATGYDVYLGTNPNALTSVYVPAQLNNDPPLSYSYTPSTLAGNTTYYWKVVSRTNATPRDPSMVASSGLQVFTTAGSVTPPPPNGTVPAPWVSQDIGAVGTTGGANYSNGVFTVAGAGADIYGTADAFRYVSQPTSGDVEIVARVASEQNTQQWAKAGLMLRQSLSATSAQIMLDVVPGGTLEFMTRASNGASTTVMANGSQPVPGWLRLVRSGSTVTAYSSSNGSSWTTIGSTTTTISASANIGFAVTSHDPNTLNTSTFDNVAVTTPTPPPPPAVPGTPSSPTPASGATGVSTSPTLTWASSGATTYDVKFGTSNPPPQVSTNQPAASYAPSTLATSTNYFWQIVARNSTGTTAGPVWSFTTTSSAPPPNTVPAPWTAQDVGSTGSAGSTSYSNGIFTVRGAGADVWGTADSFHYVSQTTSGDVQIVARVTGMQNTQEWAKAGVMLRQSLTASSAQVQIDVVPSGTIEFMTRASNGATTTVIANASQPFPAWLRLVRSGNTVTASVSGNGSSWTTVGSTTTTIPASANIGLAVTSHDPNTINTSTFDNVAVTTPAAPAPGTPTSPSPSNGATGVSTSPTLTWASSGATTYDVRFGTTNPPTQVSTDQASASYTPSALAAGTTYFWQIAARNSGGTTIGPVWSFTTSAPPPAAPGTPTSPSPANGATGVSTSPTLTWTSSGATTYDVRFGTTNPPPQVSTNQASPSYAPSVLAASTTYFWQVTARNSGGTTTGPVWTFTTTSSAPPPPPAPGTPTSPSPSNGATGVSTNATLTWTSSSAASYDVRFGTSNPPVQVSTNQTAASYSPSTLAAGTTYFWQIIGRNSSGTTTGPVWSFTTATPPPAPTDVVIYASDFAAGSMVGWSRTSDPTSPGGVKLVTADNGASYLNSVPVPAPDYADITFNANANTRYTIWLRLKALANSKYNDAVWVQFSDALANGTPAYQIGSSSGLLVNLATDTNAGSLNNWGWQNSAYWLSQVTTVTFASGGSHTLRIQFREDGVQLDQIVLSPTTYLNSSPGPVTNDNTIVAKP